MQHLCILIKRRIGTHPLIGVVNWYLANLLLSSPRHNLLFVPFHHWAGVQSKCTQINTQQSLASTPLLPTFPSCSLKQALAASNTLNFPPCQTSSQSFSHTYFWHFFGLHSWCVLRMKNLYALHWEQTFDEQKSVSSPGGCANPSGGRRQAPAEDHSPQGLILGRGFGNRRSQNLAIAKGVVEGSGFWGMPRFFCGFDIVYTGSSEVTMNPQKWPLSLTLWNLTSST